MQNINKRVFVLSFLFVNLLSLNLASAAPAFYENSVYGQSAVTLKSPNTPQMSGNTGALQYAYSLSIPAGRNSLTPQVSLSYNSQTENNQNFAGFGFSLSLPFIQRTNNYGIENMYSRDDFTSSIYGELVKSNTSDVFVPKNNSTNLPELKKNGDTFELTDKSGTKYTFGGESNSLVQNANNTSEIYTWYLTDVTDIFGNNIHYTYFKDGSLVYPNSITYTNHQSSNGIYEIRFNWQDRADKMESYQPGFYTKNNKKLFNVELYVEGAKKKNWNLRYSTGVNGNRSLLAGITESAFGSDNVEKFLPETTFEYSKNSTKQQQINVGGDFDRVMDVNGDGLNDFVLSRKTQNYNDLAGNLSIEKIAYLNNGDNTFTRQNIISFNSNCVLVNNSIDSSCYQEPNNSLPFLFLDKHTDLNRSFPLNNFATDFDGDGIVDILGAQLKGYEYVDVPVTSTTTILVGTTTQVISTTTLVRTYATSSLFWSKDSSVPNFQNGYTVANINGDKLPEYFAAPAPQNTLQALDYNATVYFDVNNDGLDDKIKFYKMQESNPTGPGFSDRVYKNVWINTGRGFITLDATTTDTYNFPISYYCHIWNGCSGYNNIYADLNFDGINDYRTIYNSALAFDINGDGLADLCTPANDFTNAIMSCELSVTKADLLVKTKTNIGSESTVSYAPSTTYKNVDNTLSNKAAYPIWTINNISVNDGLGNTSITKYFYEGAFVSRPNRVDTKFAGFGKVTTTAPNGLKTISYYHQGNINSVDEVSDSISKIGQLYKQEIVLDNKVVKKDLYEYKEVPSLLTASSTTVLLSKQMTSDFDPATNEVFSTAKSNEYDNNFNLVKSVDYQDVTGTSTLNIQPLNASNTRVTEFKYNNSVNFPKLFLPTKKIQKDNFGNILGMEKYYYDGDDGEGITNGLLSQKDVFVSSTTIISEKNLYNINNGNLLAVISNRGAITEYQYDTYDLYPIKVTNDLGHTIDYKYDYTFGKVKKVIDVNGSTASTNFDAFGREIAVYKDGEKVAENIYSDTYLPQSSSIKYFSDSDTVTSAVYFDGLGRPVKTKTENVNGKFTTQDVYYNNLGKVVKESLPYETNSLGRNDNVTLPNYMFKEFVYDAFGRISETKNALGSDKVSYTPRSKTVFDKNGHSQKFLYNSDAQLITVIESNNSATYLTNYSYDLSGNLEKIVDAEGAVRNISYDLTGRKLSDELTHAVSASSSVTKYNYGLLGEFAESIFADGKKSKTEFDILGRKTTDMSDEMLNTFVYDTCDFGKGKLCVASSSDGVVKKYFYNPKGQIVQVDTFVKNTFWSPTSSVFFTYDRQGNVLSEGDGNATTTKSLSKNYLQNISFVDTNSSSTNVFANPVYNPFGQILSYDRGALKQINKYDLQNMGRLDNFSLMQYGSQSYPGFATSTILVDIPVNNSTTTATVLRKKGMSSYGLINLNKTNFTNIDYYTHNTSTVGSTKVLNPLAMSTPITAQQAKAGVEKYYNTTIQTNGMNLGGYMLYPNSSAQNFIDAIKNTTWMRRVDRNVELDMLTVFGVANPRDATVPLPTNLTIDALDNVLTWTTNKNLGIASSAFVSGYFNLFIKDRTIQMNDQNAYVQLFRKNVSTSSISYNQCDVTQAYSDKIFLNTVATSTFLKIPINQNFKNDYFSVSTSTTKVISCLMEGHSINNPQITLSTSTPSLKNEIVISHDYNKLYTQYGADESYKIDAGITVEYLATNTKPTIQTNLFTNFGQGLQAKLDTGGNDIDGDPIATAEIYFQKSASTTSTSTQPAYNFFSVINPSTTTATLTSYIDSFPFEYGQDYAFLTRVKDVQGDWSDFATSTYKSVASAKASTTSVFCSTKDTTDLGSVNCPYPDFKILIEPQDIKKWTNGANYIPFGYAITNATITIATTSNISSSTINVIPLENVNLNDLTQPGIIKNNDKIRFKQNSKYYYSYDLQFAYYNPNGAQPFVYTNLFTTTKGPFVFTTGDFKIFQNSSYSYDTLGRIKSILKDEDSKYENTLYTYDELSRLTTVAKNFSSGTSTLSTVENFEYSPTGKILNNTGKVYAYSGTLSHAPIQVGSDILSWDTRGRLASSTSIGKFVWNDFDRVKEIAKGATTSKYYYDTEGNRVLSLIFQTKQLTATTSTSTLVSKLFTPNASTQNTGTTTSYTISLGNKPIVNIDRSFVPTFVATTSTSTVLQTIVSTSTEIITKILTSTSSRIVTSTSTINVVSTSTQSLNVLKWIGLKEVSGTTVRYDEFKSTQTVPTYSTTDLNLNNVRPLIGRSNNVSYKQRFKFTDLEVNQPQKLTIYYAQTYNNKPYYTRIISGSGKISTGATFTPTGSKLNATVNLTNSFVITFTPTTNDITLEIGDANVVNNYIRPDGYYLNLKTTQTITTTIPQIITSTSTEIVTSTSTATSTRLITSTSTATTTIATTTYIEIPAWNTNIQTLITDHLNSIEKVLDFKTGNTMSTSTYTSFGKLTKEGSTNSNRGYTNHQDDQASTGLIYMNARYQNPDYSTFISSDEATKSINSKSGLIANPQSLNAYSYTWNNPINAYDPDGRLTIIVPGTWYGSDWSKTNNLFINSMNSFGEIPMVMNEKNMWSGGNVVRDRSTAAGYLSDLINNYSFKDGEKLNIVAHSHGGNVAKEAIGLLKDGVKVDNFVTLGTPVRDDYKTDMNKVNKMVEVYSYVDWTQMLGGNSVEILSLPGYYANRGSTPFELGMKSYFEIGGAGRYEFSSGERNRWVNATFDTSFRPFPFAPGKAHGQLWSVQSVWNKVDSKLNK